MLKHWIRKNLLTLLTVIIVIITFTILNIPVKAQATIYQFSVQDLNKEQINLSAYKGKVLLIVNTASECGFTPQLKELEELYLEFKDQGFEILAFPSNQFGNQEPLDGAQIQTFCERKYQTTFKIFNKIDVKGANQHPLFHFLSNKSLNGKVNIAPKWNFQKYLINKNGEVEDFYLSITKPNSSKVKKAVKNLLAN